MSKTVHAFGMALLIGFAAAFLLSGARAARPAAATPPDRIELAELVVRLSPPVGAPSWNALLVEPRLHWLSAPATTQPWLSAPNASAAQHAAVHVTLDGRPARHWFRLGERTIQGWRLTAWGNAQSPAILSLTGADSCDVACLSPRLDLETVLRDAKVEYAIECDTRVARHYRIEPVGKAPVYAVEYRNLPAREMSFLLFWSPPPRELRLADGCVAATEA